MSKPMQRYDHADLIVYAPSVSEEISSSELKKYSESLKGANVDK